MSNTTYPELSDLLQRIGQAGHRMAEIEASEGAAGTLSVCLRWPVDVCPLFPIEKEIQLPQAVPRLAGVTIIVSGSGRRLREIRDEPAARLACIRVNEGGDSGRLYTSQQRRFERVTSEFNLHLTYLSHVPRYQEMHYLNSHLLRWQPETILNVPEGIGFIPFCVPGLTELMSDNVESLRTHRIVVWAKHGVMARSDVSIKHAEDLVEYAEAAAKNKYLNLAAGEIDDGLSPEEIRQICTVCNVRQDIF